MWADRADPRRRRLVVALVGVAFAAPWIAFGQDASRKHRIGYLLNRSRAALKLAIPQSLLYRAEE